MARPMVKDARRLGVYGASGSGKSTCVKALLAGAGRAVVFDPMDEYRAYGFRRCTDLKTVLAGIKAGWGRGFRLAYVPPANREPEALHKLAVLLKGAQAPYMEERDPRKLTLVVEELNLSYPVASLPRELYGMGELCSRGRHYGIEVIGVAQRLSEVSTRFRGNCSAQYLFRQAAHVDVATIGKIIGPKWAAEMRNLPNHHYLLLREGTSEPERGENLLK